MDTGGQEKFNAINERYYKQADCCLLVYDITSMESFQQVKKYYVKKIKGKCNKNIKVVLLGNKTDLEEKRLVSQEVGRDLALDNKYIFMESSCKDNYNVSDAFTALVEMTNTELKKSNKIDTISIGRGKKNSNSIKKKKKCC